MAGSANAVEHDLMDPAAVARRKFESDYEKQKAAEAAGRANQLKSNAAKQRSRAASSSARSRQVIEADARRKAHAQAAAALRALPPRTVDYNSKKPIYYDATDYLARKYGLNQAMLNDPAVASQFRDRYGLKAAGGGFAKDAKGNPLLDQQGKPIPLPAGRVSGSKYGEDGVYLGYYNTTGQVDDPKNVQKNSVNAIEHEMSQLRDNRLIIPADAAKGMIFGWSRDKITEFQKSRGIKVTGFADTRTTKLWSEGVNGAQKYYQYGGYDMTPEGYLDAKYGKKKSSTGSGGGSGGHGGGGGGGGSGAGATTTRVTTTNRTELQRALNQMFEDKLGRKATDGEVTKYLAQVNSQERKNPQVATVDAGGNSTVSGGVDPMQVAENFMTQVQGGDVGSRLAGVDYFASAMRLIGGGDL